MIPQIPWIERKFEFNFPVGLFPVIVERLRGTLLQLEAIVKNVADEKLSVKKDGKWSVKEVVGQFEQQFAAYSKPRVGLESGPFTRKQR